jgi:hypothetical protein
MWIYGLMLQVAPLPPWDAPRGGIQEGGSPNEAQLFLKAQIEALKLKLKLREAKLKLRFL